MTDQVSDNFIFHGEIVPLTSCPSLPDKNSLVLDEDYHSAIDDGRVFHTACHRLYIATWAVINKRLFLIDVIGRFRLKDNCPIFAEWVTETLICHKGELFKEYEGQWPGLYEEDIHLEIEQGILVSAKRVNNVNSEPFFAFKDAKRFAALAADYYNEPFTVRKSGEFWKVIWRRRSSPNDEIFVPMSVMELEKLRHGEVSSEHNASGVNGEDLQASEIAEESSLSEQDDDEDDYHGWSADNDEPDVLEDEYPNSIVEELDEEREDWASSSEDGWYYKD